MTEEYLEKESSEVMLVPINLTPEKIFAPNGLNGILKAVEQKVNEFKGSVETSKDRDEIKSFKFKIDKTRTFIEKARLALVSEKKAAVKLIDQEGKRARDFLFEQAEKVGKPLDEWKAAEAAIQDKRRLDEIFSLDWVEAHVIDDLFNREREIERKEAEFARIAEEAKQKEEAARLAKEQAERDERLKKEAIEQATRDAQAKIDIERQRAIKAEQDAKEAALKAERDRIAAIERAKIEKENAEKARIEAAKQAGIDKQSAIELAIRQSEERARIAKEAADRKAAEEKAIADKLAANKKHQATVNNRIISDFIKCGWAEAEAKAIVVAVATGKIADMSIKY